MRRVVLGVLSLGFLVSGCATYGVSEEPEEIEITKLKRKPPKLEKQLQKDMKEPICKRTVSFPESFAPVAGMKCDPVTPIGLSKINMSGICKAIFTISPMGEPEDIRTICQPDMAYFELRHEDLWVDYTTALLDQAAKRAVEASQFSAPADGRPIKVMVPFQFSPDVK